MALFPHDSCCPLAGLSGRSKLTWPPKVGGKPRLSTNRLSVVQVLAPALAGGLERVVHALAGGLRRRGHRVTVVTVITPDRTDHPYVDALRSDDIEVVPVVLAPRRYLAERRAVAQQIASRRAAIFHTHGYRPDLVDSGVARRRQVATVSTVHGFTGGGWKNRLYERLQCRNLRRMSAVVAVSAPLGERLAQAGVRPERLHVIPNAWSGAEPYSREVARDRLGLEPETWVIGWVGRLSREKGPDLMLQALARLPDDMLLSMVGEGPMREALRAQATDAGVDHRVRWHGLVPDAGRLMAAFDAVALSSRTEGTPMVLLEAMAARVPLVVTAVGGVPHVVGREGAITVEAKQPEALARGLRLVRDDRQKAAELVAAARERLLNEFSLEPWVERYEALYSQLVTAQR